MTKENKDTRKVPNLRFPEFTEEWETRKIKNILTIGSGRDYKHLSEGNIPVFGTGGFMASVDSFLYDGESVCIGRKGTINKPFYFNGKFWTVDTLFFTHSFKNVLPKFIYYIFEQINWLKYNEASGVPSLSKSTIEQIEIDIPSIDEQKKITNFLNAIDLRIDCSIKTIEELNSLKATLANRIFSQELRFKDENGIDFPDWKKRKLGEILQSLSTKKYQIKTSEIIQNGNFAVIDQGQGLIAGYSNEKDKLFNEVPVIIFGDHTTIIKYVDFPFIVGADGTKLLKTTTNDDLLYLYYNLQFNNVEQEGYKRHFTMLSEIYLQIPCLYEQQKIANFLSSIDTKIDIETQLLVKLEEQKKFLLQNIFV